MKKGKYESGIKLPFSLKKAPEAAADPNKEMKSVLLRTYFTSLISLVLCVSLFLGTSYAWFTSEVTQTGNEIHVGSLEVGLSKRVNGQWVSMKGEGAPKLFDENTIWSPGYTKVETIQIKNSGNLDFKYVMSFGGVTLTGAKSHVSVEEAADLFHVWVYEDEVKPEHYANYNQWTPVGTIRQIMAGTPLVTANLKDDNGETSHTYTIAVHMSEGANSDLMGATLAMNVKLIAYQKVAGSGFVTPVGSVAEIREGAVASKNIILTKDLDIRTADDGIVMKGGVLDGANYKINYTGPMAKTVDENGKENTYYPAVVTTNGGVISNLMITAANGRALYVDQLTSDLTVSNCTLSGAYSFNMSDRAADERTHVIRFTGCDLTGWTSFANTATRVDFVGCTFDLVLKPFGNTVLTSCTFSGDKDQSRGLDVSALEVGQTITLVNCTYQGEKIENATVTRLEDGRISISGTTKLVPNSDSKKPLALK